MKILICIDDTDNFESIGTGQLASIISHEIEKNGWGKAKGITRHQLFVHPDIPYTSHNSSMCFPVETEEKYLDNIIDYAASFLIKESAEGSDPGLCIAVLDRIANKTDELILFGQAAKTTVLTKDDAYALANQLGVHLSEHGGTGQGVIGALAGIGLRLSGNDGRFKGKHNIKAAGNTAKVDEIYSQTDIDLIMSLDGIILNNDEPVLLGEKVKSVLLENKSVLLVCPVENNTEGVFWQTCPREYLKSY
jgi:hypothetical protein